MTREKRRFITQKELTEFMRYDYETTRFYWLVRKSKKTRIGDIAGYLKKDGYRSIRIDQVQYQEHLLVWLYHYGKFPDNLIDHIDRNPSNNSIDNLRECLPSENLRNVGILKRNSSGYKGVYWDKSRGLWLAQISVDNKRKTLGRYTTAKEASDAYEAYAKLHHGEFYRDTTQPCSTPP